MVAPHALSQFRSPIVTRASPNHDGVEQVRALQQLQRVLIAGCRKHAADASVRQCITAWLID
jgi:hypothetical protein